MTIGAKQKPANPLASCRAKELAGGSIDSMSGESTTDADQAVRKQRLLKGPNETG